MVDSGEPRVRPHPPSAHTEFLTPRLLTPGLQALSLDLHDVPTVGPMSLRGIMINSCHDRNKYEVSQRTGSPIRKAESVIWAMFMVILGASWHSPCHSINMGFLCEKAFL